MIKNNKGVTLIELLIVIVVMGIIAAFAIPAVGTIIENTNQDAVVADAIAVENAAKLYCAQTQCAEAVNLYWTDISPYVTGLTASDYVFASAATPPVPAIIVSRTTSAGDWTVLLTGVSGGYTYSGTPSAGLGRANVTPVS